MMRKLTTLLLCGVLLLFGTKGAEAQELPRVIPYDLGSATIIDPALNNLEISVPLQGAIALPSTQASVPLVVILHGRHAMCGVDTAVYPCEPGEEIRYDLGFSYLMEALAGQGYAVIALNINPTLTTAYGEGDADARTAQLVDLHLQAVQAAVEGEESAFGVPLAARIDLSRIALIGHSSGGGAALTITRSEAYNVDGLLLIAAAYNAVGPERVERSGEELYAYYHTPADVAVATILPDCDGDQTAFWSQIAYEAARLDPNRTAFAASIRLFRANHNHFNSAVERGDWRFGYPPCFAETADIMPRAEQEQFLVDYASAFLASVWTESVHPVFEAALPVTDRLFGQAVEMSLSLAAERRQVIIFPQSERERHVNLLGGAVKPSDGSGLLFCGPGETCLAGITAMGRFGYLRLSYPRGGAFRFDLPEANRDLSAYSMLHLRAVPDYTSTLNTVGTNAAFAIILTDADGNEDEVRVNDLSFQTIPAPAAYYGYSPFALYPASVRIPLSLFEVDRTQVVSISLRALDNSGTLLLADLELLRPAP